jgi:hypothetical protein
MWLSTGIVFSHDCVILDACCAINLHASGHMEDILEAIPGTVALATFVLDEEILRSNLQPFVERGLIRTVSPDSEAEENSFVNFAVELDDGEAVTGAIAMHRHWGVATDDRKAQRVFARTNPGVQLLSTPDLLKHWADTRNPPLEVVREALQNIQTQASYKPSATHSLHAWWQSIVQGP